MVRLLLPVAAMLALMLTPLNRASAQEEKSGSIIPSALHGGAVELLYSEPRDSTNKRFSDMQDTHFDGGGTYHGQQFVVRGRGDFGDGTGFDGRFAAEITYLAADAKRTYDTGSLKLSHRYAGFALAAGTTYFITPQIAPYIELALLLPPFKNEVSISSSAGKATFKSDYNGSWLVTSGMNYGAAIGLDVHVYDSWLVKAHLDSRPEGSGKVGGGLLGVGYAF